MGCPFFKNNTRSFWHKLKSFFSFTDASTINLQAILDTTIDAIITIDEKKEILSFNKAAERIFGYTKDEVIGRNVNILMPEPFHIEHDGYLDHYFQTGEKKIIGIGREVVALRKDGSVFPIDLAVSEVILDRSRLFTGIIRDITQKKEAEELKQKNIRMEAEVSAKNEYISILSHELRTPMTAIQGSLGLILIEKDFPEKTQDLLSIAYRNAERLGNITKIILDVEKLQSGKLEMELKPTLLVPLVKESIATSQFLARAQKVTLVDELPLMDIWVLSDHNRLIQVCLNLISNAIKFSPSGEKVRVYLKIMGEKVRVSVEDYGPGIAESFQPKLFTPFSQASQGNMKVEGIGLGLHICKKIMDQFGGEIGFTTQEGNGSTFYFELPIYRNSCEQS